MLQVGRLPRERALPLHAVHHAVHIKAARRRLERRGRPPLFRGAAVRRVQGMRAPDRVETVRRRSATNVAVTIFVCSCASESGIMLNRNESLPWRRRHEHRHARAAASANDIDDDAAANAEDDDDDEQANADETRSDGHRRNQHRARGHKFVNRFLMSKRKRFLIFVQSAQFSRVHENFVRQKR